MKELVETMARGLVRDPSSVRVTERIRDGVLHLELEVAPSDRGRVIGRGGRTAEALRTVLQAVGRRQGRPCELKILD